ncbi:hypothetical protein WJX72_000514 [[Myrmecia] bisecta]|uniref:Uncharacterized protein n=1 Tax=[Myrmecia] bisecta TaxID=41462 RepID=A0AAW1PH47_9CHLO
MWQAFARLLTASKVKILELQRYNRIELRYRDGRTTEFHEGMELREALGYRQWMMRVNGMRHSVSFERDPHLYQDSDDDYD